MWLRASPLTVHGVILDCIDPYRLEWAGTDVQGHKGTFNAAGGQFLQQALIEMQTRRGGGYGACFPGVNGLVAFPIGGFVRTVHIGRQWHVANPLEHLKHWLLRLTDEMKQRFVPPRHSQRSAILKDNLLPLFQCF